VLAVCTSFCTLSLTGSSDAFITTVHASPCLFCPTNEVVLSLSWYLSTFQRLSTLLAPCSSIGLYCNIMAELFSKDHSSCPRRTAPWPSSETEDPVEKSYPSGCTYNSHIKKFSCVLYAHSQFLCILAGFKLSTLGVHYRSHIPSLLDCHSRSLYFLQL